MGFSSAFKGLNREGRQFSRLQAGELYTSACRVYTARASLCSAVMWPLLVTHTILLFPLLFSFRASPRAIIFQLDSTASTYKMPPSLKNSSSFQNLSTGSEAPKAQAVITIWSSSICKQAGQKPPKVCSADWRRKRCIYKQETYLNFKNIKIKYSLFWDVTQYILAVADVSGQPTVPFSRVKGLHRWSWDR
jgi:hypothetical protein